ncbi:GNAT family N-acetyltransferase [Rossellomorea sp. KS-H15a]|jgi:N-acetyltransferase|uniref:GNAT family N-acetyltransferase n=1 Tax=Rossellomorea sp. KS-H15a TaxID=2963940 RepID=UPI0020C648F3|nr:GNAT family protein [Rossellomorea sp. KS-H15a]UTE78659.1 GNAT family N-acetyltransferase [Rossellomorea sp. KS-H15a]
MKTNIFQSPPTLENEKIKLIPLEVHHSATLLEANDPEIWRFMLTEITTHDQMEQWVTAAIRLRDQQTAIPFAVVLKEQNKIIGSTRLFEINLTQKSCELGSTWYSKDHQRSFVNSNCKFLSLRYCFETLGMMRVQIKTDERNLRSQRAIERLGAVKEGVLRKERILSGGYVRNAVVYSIIDEEWPSIKEGFAMRNSKY